MGSISFDFTGKTVIVTGAAQGIGRELSRGFAQANASVVMVDRDEEAVAAAASEMGAIGIGADVSQTDNVKRAVSAAIATTGRVDVLVNNAGIVRDHMLWKLTDEDWDTVLAVHLGGTFRCTRACVEHFRAQGGGRVINVTSYSGIHGNVGQANYAAAKAGIIGFTKTAAKELARFAITVNAISPNARTAMVASIPDAQLQQLSELIPAKRFAEPAEMWPAVGLLASDEAGYITGVILPVDGGISI
jgi:3-oxoacyl-[acyl-carrier protein] reductase